MPARFQDVLLRRRGVTPARARTVYLWLPYAACNAAGRAAPLGPFQKWHPQIPAPGLETGLLKAGRPQRLLVVQLFQWLPRRAADVDHVPFVGRYQVDGLPRERIVTYHETSCCGGGVGF